MTLFGVIEGNFKFPQKNSLMLAQRILALVKFKLFKLKMNGCFVLNVAKIT